MKQKSQLKPPPNLAVRIPTIVAFCLTACALALAAFVGGYTIAFFKVQDALAETAVLKARANELEAEIQRLKNYAVLIDAITTNGRAANELYKLPNTVTQDETKDSSTATGGRDGNQ